MEKRARPANRVLATLVSLLALTLVLAGCGARIDTLLKVNADGSGERVMTLTLSAEDVKSLVGGTATADSSIKGHLPKVLTYSGLQVQSDGSVSAVLTLSFESAEDYIAKSEELLALGSATESEPIFVLSDSLLVRGLEIDESYSSASLLNWLFAGLLADGVVESSTNQTDMFELGATTLQYAGEKKDMYGGLISAKLVSDAGFSSVRMATDISDVNNITRSITFVPGPDGDEQLYSDYFDAATPRGADLTRDGADWVLVFSGDADQISGATDVALSGVGSKFSVTRKAGVSDPASVVLTVSNSASCDAVCAQNSPALTDTILTADEFNLPAAEMDMTSGEPLQLEFVPAFTAVTQRLDFALLGGFSATTEFEVATSNVSLVGEGFEELLAPPAEGSTISSSASGGVTTYIVTVAASTIDEFNLAYATWAPSGGLSVETGSGANFFGGPERITFVPGLESIVGTHAVESGTATSVQLPFGKWATAGATDGDSFNGTVRFESFGVTFAGMVAFLGTTLLLAGCVFLLVRHRARVTAFIKNRASAAVGTSPNTATRAAGIASASFAITPASKGMSLSGLKVDPALAPGRVSLSSIAFQGRPVMVPPSGMTLWPAASHDSNIRPSLIDIRTRTGN